jgi:hypothetical protein
MAFKRAEAEQALNLVQQGNLYALAETLRTFFRGPIVITAGLTLTPDYLNRTVVHNAAGGGTVILPPATGGGDKLRLLVKTTVTSSLIVRVANASDTMQGTAFLSQDAADTPVTFDAAATSDTITLNGTTTGGLFGAEVECEDVATNLWHVRVISAATGVEATPFSAAV